MTKLDCSHTVSAWSECSLFCRHATILIFHMQCRHSETKEHYEKHSITEPDLAWMIKSNEIYIYKYLINSPRWSRAEFGLASLALMPTVLILLARSTAYCWEADCMATTSVYMHTRQCMFMCTYKSECICESILASGSRRARGFAQQMGGGVMQTEWNRADAFLMALLLSGNWCTRLHAVKLKPPASSFLISNPANATLFLCIDRMAAPDKPPGQMVPFAHIYLYGVDYCYSSVDHVLVFQSNFFRFFFPEYLHQCQIGQWAGTGNPALRFSVRGITPAYWHVW